MNITVKRTEEVIIDKDTERVLYSLLDELADIICVLDDETDEVNDLRNSIENFLSSENVRVE